MENPTGEQDDRIQPVEATNQEPTAEQRQDADSVFSRYLLSWREAFARRRPEDQYLLDAFGRLLLKVMPRRGFLKAMGKGALIFGATVVGVDQGLRLPELLNPEPPKITFDPDQRQYLDKERISGVPKRAVIVFGAATVQDPSRFGTVDALKAPFNNHDLPVGYLSYANYGLDPERTAAELEKLKTELGVDEIIGVFQSAGFQFVAEAFSRVGDRLNLILGILLSTPTDASTTRFSWLINLAKAIDPVYSGGFITSGAANYQRYNNPFRRGAAGPDLAYQQSIAIADGRHNARLYRPRVERGEMALAFVTTANPANDDVIYSEQSLEGLEEVLGTEIPEYPLNAGHADPAGNPEEHARVIESILEDLLPVG